MTREECELSIEYLEDIKDNYIEGHGYERHPLPEYYAIETAIKALEQEPKTITEFADRCQECGAKYGKALEQTRWIPVSERLPEKNDVYLVAVNSWGCPTRDVDGFMAHTDRKWEVYWNKVIAWMPLPEPYRESEEV